MSLVPVKMCGTMARAIVGSAAKEIMQSVEQRWIPGRSGGIGGLPISLDRRNVSKALSDEYVACEKTDGERQALAFVELHGYNLAVMVSRRGNIVMLDCSNIRQDLFQGTLLDGELVEARNRRWHYVVFDSSMVCGDYVGKKNYVSRLSAAKQVVQDLEVSGIRISVKTVLETHNLRTLVDFVIPRLPYATDGLIFVRKNDPVVSGTSNSTFKWKDPKNITLDFATCKTPRKNVYELFAAGKGEELVHVASTAVDEGMTAFLIECEVGMRAMCIVEFRLRGDSWALVRLRRDKTRPNSIVTVRRTIQTIKDDLGVSDLFKRHP